MRFRVLGAVELVDDDGVTRPVGSTKQRQVLAALLARPGEVVTLDTLTEALWGEDQPATAVGTLRTYVSRLRSDLGTTIVARGAGFALDVAATAVDAGRFDVLVDEASRAGPAEAAALLDEAIALWRGPAFGDQADLDCVRGEARRLEERRIGAREARAAALLAAGRAADAVAAAEALVTDEPLREGAWSVLVDALAAADRPAEALRAYRRAADELAEAGLEPSARLRESERAVLAGDGPSGHGLATAGSAAGTSAGGGPAGGGPAGGGPAASGSAPRASAPSALPRSASSFVGRDHDLDVLDDLLDRARVLTLLGPGGVGKTRLAIEIGHRVAARLAMGAAFVELGSVPDGDAVPEAVVDALGLEADGPAIDVLGRAGPLPMLVVLDNAEHVVDAAAATVERLVAGGAALRVLVTSRERLGVDGEHVWTVAPLPITGEATAARALFVERATAVAPDLRLDVDDPRVANVVERLDGLPLALEMAAAQLATASLDELAATLADRVDHLQSSRRHVAERHRSLAAVLRWSEDRLDERQAETLAELAVFAGPVQASDVAGVLGGAERVDTVRELAARSLVQVDRSGAAVRFQLLQTIRSFAAQRLAEHGRTEALERRHATWFTGVVAEADAALRGTDEAAGHHRVDGILAELRAAHRWAMAHDLSLAGRLSAHLHVYAQSHMLDEPLQWAAAVAERLPEDDPSLPVVLASVANRAIKLGDLDQARLDAGRGAELGDAASSLPALEALADASLFDARPPDPAVTYARLAERAAEVGDVHYLVLGRTGVELAEVYAGGDRQPFDYTDLEALPLSSTARGWLAYARAEAGQAADPERAFEHYDEAIAAARPVGNRLLEGVAMVSACALRARVGDIPRALATFDDAIVHWIRLANVTHLLTTLRNLVVLLHRAGAPHAAAELLGAVERGGTASYGDEAVQLQAASAWVASALAADDLEALLAAGESRDVITAAVWARDAIAALRAG